nr:hypothetical protein BaRGS_010258 [Batillaria attramentaria]
MVPPYTYNNDGTFNPVDVGVTLKISSILGLDMRSQQFTFTGWFMASYTDRSLSWNSSIYSVDAIYVKPDDIWTPDMVLSNSVFPADQLVKQKLRVIVLDSDAEDSAALAGRSEVKDRAVDWQRMGVVIDKICFPVFTGFCVLSFVIYGIVTAL